MERAYSVLCFALLQVLMFAVCASECPEGVKVHCPNKTGPVGEALNLTCQVTCDTTVLKEGVNISFYKWSKNDNGITKEQLLIFIINYTFYHTIANLSAQDYGTYTFWIQMTSGLCTELFTVNQAGLSVPATASDSGPLVPATASPSGPSMLETASLSELLKDETKNHLGVWFTMPFLAIVAIAVVLYTKRKEICHLFQPDLPHSQDTLLDTP